MFVYELRKSELDVKTKVPVPVGYDGFKLADVGFRIDVLVADKIVIEMKSLESVAPVHCCNLLLI
jgi:GxxExxY protein